MEIDGVGSIVALHFRDGLQQRRAMLDDLLTLVVVQEQPSMAFGGPFDGKTFCLTGTLSKPRKEIQQLIQNAGGKVVGSVSEKLGVLIAGEKAGSKKTKAEALGVTIWSESNLMAELESQGEDESGDAPEQSRQPTLLDF